MQAPSRVITIDEITLVPRTSADAAEYFALVDAHRAALREYLTWIDATTTVGDARRYAQFAHAQFEARVGFDYTIRANGVIAGGIGLHDLDWSASSAHIGYWLAPNARGKGLVTRSCAALTTHAFEALNFHRLEIRCVTENVRSRAVAERLGYDLEGFLAEAYLLNGRYRDLALYAMLRSNWDATAGKRR